MGTGVGVGVGTGVGLGDGLGVGVGVPLYLAAWVLIPAEGSGIVIADEVLNHVASHLS